MTALAKPPTIKGLMTQALVDTPWKRLYGLVDAARCMQLVTEAEKDFGAIPQSLFLPEAREGLREIAPYFFAIDFSGEYLRNWADRFGSSAGILLISAASPETLYEHLRRTFVVADESGQEFFFRFYDPRVLRPFLPTCSASQLEEFFGPIEEFAVEADDGESLIRYRRENGKVTERRVPVDIEPGS